MLIVTVKTVSNCLCSLLGADLFCVAAYVALFVSVVSDSVFSVSVIILFI